MNVCYIVDKLTMSASQTTNDEETKTETFNMFDFDFGPNAKNNAFLENLMKNVTLQEKFTDKEVDEEDDDDESDTEDDSEGESEYDDGHLLGATSDNTKRDADTNTSSLKEELVRETNTQQIPNKYQTDNKKGDVT